MGGKILLNATEKNKNKEIVPLYPIDALRPGHPHLQRVSCQRTGTATPQHPTKHHCQTEHCYFQNSTQALRIISRIRVMAGQWTPSPILHTHILVPFIWNSASRAFPHPSLLCTDQHFYPISYQMKINQINPSGPNCLAQAQQSHRSQLAPSPG